MDDPTLDRRTFIRGIGATAGVATVGVGSQAVDAGPVQEAEAIPPLILAGAAIGGSVALGWALREFEVVGSDPPPEGLTQDPLKQEVYSTARTRKSTNASSFVDNRNILGGINHVAYAEGKIAAIEALNQELPQADVQSAGQEAVGSYGATIQKNLAKTWNESINELETLWMTLTDHPDIDPSRIIQPTGKYNSNSESPTLTFPTKSLTLADGTSFDLLQIDYDAGNSDSTYNRVIQWDLTNLTLERNVDQSQAIVHVRTGSGDSLDYLRYSDWEGIWSDLDSRIQSVKDGLSTWVSNVYSEVQAGTLDTSELLTPRELAQMTADNKEQFNQAVADLMALNIAVDLEREAEIRLPDIGATLRGSLAVSGETTLTPGTVNPSSDNLSYYFTYDVSTGSGTWDAYNQGIDGGTLTFTKEPFPSALYVVSTAAGEQVEVKSGEFTDQGDGTFTVDLSGKLDTAITNAESIEYYSQTEETRYETVQLTAPFEIVAFRDSEGNEVDSADYTQTEPQDDTNYITEEEWKQQQQRYEELIKKYEKAKSGGGGGGFSVDVGNIPPAGLALGAGALLAFLLGNQN